jgi:hypothetical protein
MVVSSFAILRKTILSVYYAAFGCENVGDSQPEVDGKYVGMRCWLRPNSADPFCGMLEIWIDAVMVLILLASSSRWSV